MNENQLVVYFQYTGLDAAYRNCTNTSYAVHVLYRYAERLVKWLLRDLEQVQGFYEYRTLVPWHLVRFLCNIVAYVSRSRNEIHIICFESNTFEKFYHCLFCF